MPHPGVWNAVPQIPPYLSVVKELVGPFVLVVLAAVGVGFIAFVSFTSIGEAEHGTFLIDRVSDDLWGDVFLFHDCDAYLFTVMRIYLMRIFCPSRM